MWPLEPFTFTDRVGWEWRAQRAPGEDAITGKVAIDPVSKSTPYVARRLYAPSDATASDIKALVNAYVVQWQTTEEGKRWMAKQAAAARARASNRPKPDAGGNAALLVVALVVLVLAGKRGR